MYCTCTCLNVCGSCGGEITTFLHYNYCFFTGTTNDITLCYTSLHDVASQLHTDTVLHAHMHAVLHAYTHTIRCRMHIHTPSGATCTYTHDAVLIAHTHVVLIAHTHAVLIAHTHAVLIAHTHAVLIAHTHAVLIAHTHAVLIAHTHAVLIAHTHAVLIAHTHAVLHAHTHEVLHAHTCTYIFHFDVSPGPRYPRLHIHMRCYMHIHMRCYMHIHVRTSFTSTCPRVPGTLGFSIPGRSYW